MRILFVFLIIPFLFACDPNGGRKNNHDPETDRVIGEITGQSGWNENDLLAVSKSDCTSLYKKGSFVKIEEDGVEFELFYFIPTGFDPSRKTAFYHPGGPGGFHTHRLDENPAEEELENFNVVVYHPRGAGCSQIPKDKKYDKLLSVKSEVSDLERIRKDLKIESWDVLFGASHGTIVAGLYAKKYPDKVKRVLYKGVSEEKEPLKRGRPYPNGQVLETAEKILQANGYSQEKVKTIVGKLNDIFESSDDAIMPSLARLSILAEVPEYRAQIPKRYDAAIKHSPEFFMVGYLLVYSGWSPKDKDTKKALKNFALVLAAEFYPNNYKVPAKLKDALQTMMIQSFPDLFKVSKVEETEPVSLVGNRTFSVISSGDRFDYPVTKWGLNTDAHIVTGDADGATPDVHAKKLYNSLLGNRRLVVVNGGGHWGVFPESCPQEFYPYFLSPDEKSKPTFFDEKDHSCFLETTVEWKSTWTKKVD